MESIDLRRTDLRVDADVPFLRVRNGKFNKDRTVGMHPEAVEAIDRWLEVAPESEYVFCTLRGGRLDDGYVRAMLRRKGARAGVERVHPHAFRATLAVELVTEGVPLPSVRDVLGHASIGNTDAYLRRVFPEAAVSAVIHRSASSRTSGNAPVVAPAPEDQEPRSTFRDDYVITCAGSCYIAGTQVFPNGTQVVTIKGKKSTAEPLPTRIKSAPFGGEG